MQGTEYFTPRPGTMLVTALAGIAVLAVVLWFVGWHYFYVRRMASQIILAPVVQTQRERWISALQSLQAEDLRELHQMLSRTMREFLGERAGRDLSTWTVADLRAAKQFVSVCELLEAWEQPAFGPVSRADAKASIQQAIEEVSSW
jgi:hypothetical protein